MVRDFRAGSTTGHGMNLNTYICNSPAEAIQHKFTTTDPEQHLQI